ncbi:MULTISPECIES: Ail/Lom family outer membrane beta-barrel protein [unclassified Photorhabdus]|uniref:Ail/Lom family outer membrane beta-barrel protein n=1 Tax=unclassified Photorhabdus TaxID=2620880 RepID=UPI000DCB1CE8|nr:MULTISPECIES: Ail/Lom family outer membrane beta-barrel protein [unclassified Photorhabdus]RAX04391.1 attachment protein [Photorhabdus sp. S9-53]RAX04722.1 attachment protein [Photorhabdus sp. S10-54]RAX06340.1 attachment protein [Photorhabdus sp. S8-52]
MKRTFVASVVAVGLSVFAFAANAGEHTISGGYAQSHVKFDDKNLADYHLDNNPLGGNPKGFNLKYRYELDSNWGVIGSFTYTHLGNDLYINSSKIGKSELDYYSLMAGPTYRFNEYVSAYGMIGAAHGKVKASYLVNSNSGSDGYSKTSIGYGLGLQFNPVPNWTIDTSYEYAKFNEASLGDLKVGTWVVGVGYRF